MNNSNAIRSYLLVYAALGALLALTISISFFHLGAFNIVAALGIALMKMLLIVLFFMRVKRSSRLTWLFVGAGFFWLGILLVLTLGDYFTRAGFTD